MHRDGKGRKQKVRSRKKEEGKKGRENILAVWRKPEKGEERI